MGNGLSVSVWGGVVPPGWCPPILISVLLSVESSSMSCAQPALMLGRGKLGLGTPYGIERLCGRSRKACSSLASGVAAELLKRQTKPTELAWFSSVPSPSFPLGLRPRATSG